MSLDACVEIYFPSFDASLCFGEVSGVVCLNSFFLNPCFVICQQNSEMSLLGRWLGNKKPERTDRVTRASASPSTARVSYNEEIVPLELLEDTSPARAMMFPCPTFMEAAGIQEGFESLCANAGLTRLATCRVIQYKKLTSCFINSCIYYPDADTIEFRLYNELLTMSMKKYCEAVDLPDAGKKAKMSS